MAKTLYIIDGHAHIYAAYYAPMRPLTSPTGEPTKATYIFTTAVLGLIERHKPDMLVVAMDSKAKPFRCEMYPEYKAQRPPMPEDMPVQIKRIEQILEALRIPLLRVDGFEADDLIGTLTTKAAKNGIESFICSKDKDMLQLLDEHTRMLDIKTGKETTTESMAEETGLTPAQFVDVLALQGDTSDNIPGVPDVGPKTAIQWIQKYGSLDGLYAHADEIGGKRGDNLRSHKEQAYLSRELVIINRDAPVNVDKEQFTLQEPDSEKLAQLFTELDFSRLLTQFGLSRDQAVLCTSKNSDAASATGSKKTERDYQLIDTEEALKTFTTELKKQNIFAVDTETTSTDPMRADLVGMSFSWQAGQAWYLAIKSPLGQKHLDIASVRKQIGPILADSKVRKIGQNIKYDMLVLTGAQMSVEGIYFDTMVASYCLDADRPSHGMDSMARDYLGIETIPLSSLIGKGKNQLTFDMVDTQSAGEYAAEDADVTWQLYEYLRPKLEAEPKLKTLFEEIEMPLVSVLAALEKNGVSLDVQMLKRMSNEISEELETITDQIHALAEGPFNIDSPKQLAEILFDRLGLRSIKEGKTLRSTDAGVLEQLQYEHPIVPLILQYRQLGKLKNTYLDKLGGMINPRSDRLHASFNQTVTATGRLSSSDPNLQNIPIRTELGRKIRSAFVPARKSDCILSADYSQIELRLLAHFSQDAALRKAFAEDQDIHRFVASQVYGIELGEVTDKMRSNAKAVNFGIIYGQGPFGLSRTIGISLAEAKQFIEDYYARYGSIRSFMDEVIVRTKKTGYAETILGRRRPITGLGSKNHNRRSQAERMAVNTVIQGSAADLIKVAMIHIQQHIQKQDLPIQMILQIHDELVFELPRKEAQNHSEWITHEMAHAIELDVPMKVDVSIGSNWLGDK
ncbi:MAG: DNA polymerase I [Sedimentisphaerales bacterium]|nr:DNA polymerase I [Sedimentisphaerales bacterium]